jgi:hypothetical protein
MARAFKSDLVTVTKFQAIRKIDSRNFGLEIHLREFFFGWDLKKGLVPNECLLEIR